MNEPLAAVLRAHIVTASWDCHVHGCVEYACVCGPEFTREQWVAHVVAAVAAASTHPDGMPGRVLSWPPIDTEERH